MNLTVFGASGRTGRPLVRQALDAGHAVTAFVRDPTRLGVTHDRLRVVVGEAADVGAVARAVEGANAVVSALGPAKGAPPDLLAASARGITAAMGAHGVRRLVVLTGAGVEDPADPPYWGATAVRMLMGVVARDLLADARAMAAHVRGSGLDWTLLRAPRLTDGPATGRYRLGLFRMGLGHAVARADVAAALLRLAAADEYVRAAPMITSKDA